MSSPAQAIISSSDGLYIITTGDMMMLKASLIATKNFVVNAMHVWNFQIFLYTAQNGGSGAVYSMPFSLAPNQQLTKLFSTDSSSSNERGYFYETKDSQLLHLICKDSTHIWLWDVMNRTKVSSAISSSMPRVMAYVPNNDGLLVYVMMENLFLAVVDQQHGIISLSANARSSVINFWDMAFNAAFQSSTAVNFQYIPMNVTYVPPLLWSDQPILAPPTITQTQQVSPIIVLESMVGPRWLVSPAMQHGHIIGLGSEQAIRSLEEPSSGLCDGGGAARLALDTPLSYNVLNKLAYDGKDSRTYFDVLADAMLPVASNECNRSDMWGAALQQTFPQHQHSGIRMIENPVSKSWWVLHEGSTSLKEISRRGVSVERAEDGRCIPTHAGLCPSCQWSSPGGQCVSCTVVGEGLLEWQLQCQSCVASMGLGRRLLFSTTSNIIIMLQIVFVILHDGADLLLLFGKNQTTVTMVGPNLMEITIDTLDPQAAMRDIYATLATTTNSTLVTKPRLRLLVPSPSSASSVTHPPLHHFWLYLLFLLNLFFLNI